MVRYLKRGLHVAQAGRVFAERVAQNRNTPGFVMRHPVLDAVAQPPDRNLTVTQVASIVARFAQTPRSCSACGSPSDRASRRASPCRQQRVDDALIVVQPFGLTGHRHRDDALPGHEKR